MLLDPFVGWLVLFIELLLALFHTSSYVVLFVEMRFLSLYVSGRVTGTGDPAEAQTRKLHLVLPHQTSAEDHQVPAAAQGMDQERNARNTAAKNVTKRRRRRRIEIRLPFC